MNIDLLQELCYDESVVNGCCFRFFTPTVMYSIIS